MNLNLDLIALVGIWVALFGMLWFNRINLILLSLALGFLFSALLLVEFWSIKLTASYLVSGWMATAMFGVTLLTGGNYRIKSRLETSIFLLIFSILSILLIFVAYPLLSGWFIAASSQLLISALSSIAVGGILISLSGDLLKTLSGYLFILIGFILFYSQLENSMLVVSLLAALILFYALIGSYLIIVSIEVEP
ncbi:MAG TPA: hypothetical protein VN226_10455 [Anaerolineales bacterium]|nr:hypothetical protein [Anaerolineales bacterium]